MGDNAYVMSWEDIFTCRSLTCVHVNWLLSVTWSEYGGRPVFPFWQNATILSAGTKSQCWASGNSLDWGKYHRTSNPSAGSHCGCVSSWQYLPAWALTFNNEGSHLWPQSQEVFLNRRTRHQLRWSLSWYNEKNKLQDLHDGKSGLKMPVTTE